MADLSITDQGSSTTDNLFIESFDSGPFITGSIASGEGVLARGSVLAKTSPNVPTTGTADGGNTGNGTMTAVAVKSKTKTGTYTMTCITAVADGGVFNVFDPDGLQLDDATEGVTYSSDQLTFLLTDGAADWIVGDIFTVAVVVGALELTLVDGDTAFAVLLEDVDATSSAVNASIAERGHFDENHLIFGGTDTIETHRVAMRAIGLYTSIGDLNPNTPAGT